MIVIYLFLIGICYAVAAIVNFPSGAVILGNEIDVAGRKVHEFMGVPYGKRHEKFTRAIYQDPKWTLLARTPGRVCPQMAEFMIPQGAELIVSMFTDLGDAKENFDCATLDIYRPAVAKNGLKVMVLIHGGSLTAGSRRLPIYDAKNIFRIDEANENMIIVSIEHSLGPYGFWYDPREKLANEALLEVLDALRWVQNNIVYFGGDPQNVTLVGHSAGASLAQYTHFLLHDASRYGFAEVPFQKMILMSGSAYLFAPSSAQEALALQKRFAAKLGCDIGDDQLSCLRSHSDKSISKVAKEMNLVWAPVIDGEIIKGNVDFYLNPADGIPKLGAGVKVLITNTVDDGSIFCVKHRQKAMELRHLVFREFGHEHLGDVLAPRYEAGDPFIITKDIVTNAVFGIPARKSAEAYKRAGLIVSTHQLDFRIVHIPPNSLVYAILERIRTHLGLNVPLEEILLNLHYLGCFHTFDQAILFDASIFSLKRLAIDGTRRLPGNILSGLMNTLLQTMDIPYSANLDILPGYAGMRDAVSKPLFAFMKDDDSYRFNPIPEPCAESKLIDVKQAVFSFYCPASSNLDGVSRHLEFFL